MMVLYTLIKYYLIELIVLLIERINYVLLYHIVYKTPLQELMHTGCNE